MTHFSKLTALALAALITSTSLTSAVTIYDPFGGVIYNEPSLGGPKPPHPQGPKPPHPQTISDMDDALDGFGPAVPVKPQLPGSGKDDKPAGQGGSSSSPEQAQINCAVAATNDLLIQNVGSVDLQAGVKLKFRVRSSGDHGAFILHRTIGAGKQLLIPGMLDGATAGAACDAQIL